MSGPHIERFGNGPTIEDLQVFDDVSLATTNFGDDKQWAKWTQVAQVLSDKGWKPEQVITRLWTLRPECRTPGLSAEEAARIAITGEQEIEPPLGCRKNLHFMPL